MARLVAVGTVAFDSIETPFTKMDRVIGGAATYITLCASHFVNASGLVSVVGDDFPQSMLDEMSKRGIDQGGLQIKQGEKSFYWSGKYHYDMNSRDTLVTDLNVLATFDPVIPEAYKNCDFLMLGNLAPAVQMRVIEQLNERPKLVVMDTMNFWMDIALDELHKTLKVVDLLIINDEEARQLTQQYSLKTAAAKIMELGPKSVIIKKGEHGALLFHGGLIFSAPALPLEEVFDPTGAGDSFAGGLMGYLSSQGEVSFESLKKAVIAG
ncbi:MAG: PfkB family carbohydrate kinase, partial [Flavobacteriales bacterium]